jgi:hypothetical protein
MSAPKENQYAAGNPNSGRPPEYNLEEMAQKLEEWSKKYNSCSLNQFCSDEGFSNCYLSRWAERNEVFRQSYEMAKTRLAARREELAWKGAIPQKIFNRYQGLFDPNLRDFERGEKEFEYGLKRKLIESEKNAEIEQIKQIVERENDIIRDE